MRHYTIIGTTRGKLKRKIAKKALTGNPLKVTARERLDEFTARRRSGKTVDFHLEIDSTHHPRDGGKFVIARLVDSDAMARIEFADNVITMTVADFTEVDATSP